MQEVKKHKVYEKVPIEKCYESTGKTPIGTRWVDVNKGDKVHPECRSRLVAQEIKMNKRERICLRQPHRWRQRRYRSRWRLLKAFGFK